MIEYPANGVGGQDGLQALHGVQARFEGNAREGFPLVEGDTLAIEAAVIRIAEGGHFIV